MTLSMESFELDTAGRRGKRLLPLSRHRSELFYRDTYYLLTLLVVSIDNREMDRRYH